MYLFTPLHFLPNMHDKITLTLAQHVYTYQLEQNQLYVSKEIQKNEWYTNLVKCKLEKRGLIVAQKCSQSEFSIFGKSLPDFYFYRPAEASIQAAMTGTVEDIDDSNDRNDTPTDGKSKRLKIGHNELAHIKGSTTQFKEEDGGKRYWPQMFADMARVAHLLVVECLQIGKLVDSISVYGILAKYKTRQATPMLYTVDFARNECSITIGTDMSFCDCLTTICLQV